MKIIKELFNSLRDELAMLVEIRRNQKLNAMRKIVLANRP